MPKVLKAGTGFIVNHAGTWFRVPKKLVRQGEAAAEHLEDLAVKRAAKDAARKAAGKRARKESKRDLFLGKTPGKGSDVGAKVKARSEIKGPAGRQRVKTSGNPEVWTPLEDCDMGHKTSAVDFWNQGSPPDYPTPGKDAGPRSDYVRDFMNDDRNYELQPKGPNRSAGPAMDGYHDPT